MNWQEGEKTADNTKLDVTDTGLEGVDWIHVAEDRDR